MIELIVIGVGRVMLSKSIGSEMNADEMLRCSLICIDSIAGSNQFRTLYARRGLDLILTFDW